MYNIDISDCAKSSSKSYVGLGKSTCQRHLATTAVLQIQQCWQHRDPKLGHLGCSVEMPLKRSVVVVVYMGLHKYIQYVHYTYYYNTNIIHTYIYIHYIDLYSIYTYICKINRCVYHFIIFLRSIKLMFLVWWSGMWTFGGCLIRQVRHWVHNLTTLRTATSKSQK